MKIFSKESWKLLSASFLSLFFSCGLFAQGSVVSNLNQQLTQKEAFSSNLMSAVDVTSSPEKVNALAIDLQSNANFFDVNTKGVQALRKNNVDLMTMSINLPNHGEVVVGLFRKNIFTPDLKIETNDGEYPTLEATRILFYRGAVVGIDNSLAAITITDSEISGVISIGPENFNIGKIKNSNTHIVYNEKDLGLPENFACGTADPDYSDVVKPMPTITNEKTINCVRIRVEVDSGLNFDLGGVSASLNYVAGLFNEVITLYDNDNIGINVSEVYVWNGSSPYSGNNSAEILNQMNNSSTNADITSLLSDQGGGGIAWTPGLCAGDFGTNYNGVFGFYNSVPTFSSDVFLVAHEVGHNLGSEHTHGCAWNGNNTAIDGCGPAAGFDEGCSASLPSSGTIMSYCNLVGGVGIDFTLGFGPQPGQRIRNYVDGSSCLGTVCEAIEPTCNDGILNGFEEEIDCGGAECPSCSSNDFILNLKTMLEGPYDTVTGEMNDGLRSGNELPITEPYSALGYTVPSVSTTVGLLGITGSDAIVDWILIELRDAGDPTSVLASHAALLQRDGDIVDVDGGPLEVVDLGETSFYVAIRHRNHFGVRSDIAYNTAGGITIDFSDPTIELYGTNAMKTIGGVRVMYSGDANFDGQVNSVDKNSYWRLENGQPFIYSLRRADFNLDGSVNAPDKNFHWRVNNSIQEQLD